jgi:hypothetical protein
MAPFLSVPRRREGGAAGCNDFSTMSAQSSPDAERSAGVTHDWMIRVLEDLQTYARLHGMRALAEQLDQTRLLAMTEIANLPDTRDEGDPLP